MIADAIKRAVEPAPLEAAVVEGALRQILAGEATQTQIAAFLVALRVRGETTEDLIAAARVMRQYCTPLTIAPRPVVMDTCGTGGDGHGTFNISTATAIVLAACGVTVAKHGNRAASSKAGSADVLEALGVRIDMGPAGVAACIDTLGIGFMFARVHHPAMRHVGPVRAELGIRTLFNLIGPLSNPAGASHQLLGVYERARCESLAHVLRELGARAAWVVHGHDGVDEVSLSGPTLVAELKEGKIRVFETSPADFGLPVSPLSELAGGTAQDNARLILGVLAGERGPRRDAIVLNTAASLCVAGVVVSPLEGARVAAQAIDSGAAKAKLDAWIARSQA